MEAEIGAKQGEAKECQQELEDAGKGSLMNQLRISVDSVGFGCVGKVLQMMRTTYVEA